MSIDQVTNRNFLSPLNFRFQLKRAPHVNFFVQKVNLPGLSLPDIDVTNPLIRVPYPGDHLQYDELEVSFKVDEDLKNYMEIHEWIRALGKRTFNEYKTIATANPLAGGGSRSDISLLVLTSNRNANYEVVFKDAFPTRLSSIDFATTDDDVDYIEASATFRYVTYDITKVS